MLVFSGIYFELARLVAKPRGESEDRNELEAVHKMFNYIRESEILYRSELPRRGLTHVV